MRTSLASRLATWSAFALAAGVLFLAFPDPAFGWPQLIAVMGPYALLLDRRIAAGWFAVVAAALLVLLAASAPSAQRWVDLGVALFVLLAGTMLAAASVRRLREIEDIAGGIVTGAASRRTKGLARSLERELARARRHSREFALVSAAPAPHSIATQHADPVSRRTLQTIAEQRSLLAIAEMLRSQLHAYCEVAVAPGRVLALVPETTAAAANDLQERLQRHLAATLDDEVRLGVARFPADAVTADSLVEAADGARTRSLLRSVSSTPPPPSDACEREGQNQARGEPS